PDGLNAGFADGAVWLRLLVHDQSVSPGGRMMRLCNASVSDIHLPLSTNLEVGRLLHVFHLSMNIERLILY
ncbi:hypothetical protein CEK63_20510, partial [Xanthomonas sontii]